MTKAWYAQWSTVTESTVCFHHDTVLLCPVKHCYWVQYASIMTSNVMPCEVLLLRAQNALILTLAWYAQWSTVTESTVCFHHDTGMVCPMKHGYWLQYVFIMTQFCYALRSILTESTVCFHHDTGMVCPMKHCYWLQYASIMTQYCYALQSTFTESTVYFYYDTGIVFQMKHCYWEHSMLSSWHSLVIPCEVLLLRAQYAFIMTQAWYALWSTVTENTVCFHRDTVLYAQWSNSTENTVCFHLDTGMVCPM